MDSTQRFNIEVRHKCFNTDNLKTHLIHRLKERGDFTKAKEQNAKLQQSPMEFIVLDDQPLSVIKNEGFNWAFGATVQMPGRKYIACNYMRTHFIIFLSFFYKLVLDWYLVSADTQSKGIGISIREDKKVSEHLYYCYK